MKRTGLAQIIFELISIVGNVIVGMTILTFLAQGETIGKTFITFIIFFIGAVEIVFFLALKDSLKFKNILNLITSLFLMLSSIVLFILTSDLSIICLVWAIIFLIVYIAKIVNFVMCFKYKPLYNATKIALSTITIVYSVILIVLRETIINKFFDFIGVALMIEASVLLVEFLIHHNHR